MSTNIPRTTLITGAASGMGAALSRHLTALGERVIGVDLSNADICADLADPSQRATLVARVEQITPAVDAVVACAGVSPPVAGDTLLSVNYFGVADLLPRLLPLLHRATQPRAVVISSLASIHPVDTRLVEMCLDGDELAARQQAAKIGALCYASSKRALTQWIRRTAVLSGWADQGVLLNGIAPGVVKTPMVAPLLASAEGREALAAGVPTTVRDYASAEQIVPLLAFLAGPANGYMVGQVPFVDGGADVLLRGETAL
ncbi:MULTISPECIES: SDR family NAD(P)-dependent oxidoreductase [Burkholderia cepacia complex]|uniref:Short-chain dehydrogenase/reductase SDR n=1 Tax=Burkholderia orbicola (strain MC0-3) TaxID=406425 RepID=B1KCP1_BURO0|nr:MULTISPECIES: SDR family NAD(P)-dependent oxidoreductase [Burkholderia cepacia complex]ACA95988.1 short-chain dehydrogenase/reductase SDR [Burkholderia orbicola MC0-3]MBY4798480.1 SDR family oxidoreductase [Burkholderia cepacia]MCA8088064.1 SDR family oxidoreductase [Burkholderia cenocepacia]